MAWVRNCTWTRRNSKWSLNLVKKPELWASLSVMACSLAHSMKKPENTSVGFLEDTVAPPGKNFINKVTLTIVCCESQSPTLELSPGGPQIIDLRKLCRQWQ